LALSGIAFAVPFLIGWFASAGVTQFGACSGRRNLRLAALRNSRASSSPVLSSVMAGMSMALVVMEAASSEGGNANPVVSRAVTAGAAGPYLIAAMGFAALLMAGEVLTLRTGVFARWIGVVALVGAVSFLITFLTVLDGTTDGSPFGYGFFPGVVALVIWTIATSVTTYRASAT
jgi:hypothetical protein